MPTPDRWSIVKLTNKQKETHYRVFACFVGGYLGADAWKLNSGIVEYQDLGDRYEFSGDSGSRYVCYKNLEGMTSYGCGIYAYLKATAKDVRINKITMKTYRKKHDAKP